MAPYKLEDNIREKLEARALKPSAEAWEKLEAKLEAEQPKKKTVLWYYVAASFIGIAILASVFFSKKNTELNNQIVEKSIEQKSVEGQPELILDNSKSEEIATEEKTSEKDRIKPSEKETERKQRTNSVQLKQLPQKKSEVDKKIESTHAIANVVEVETERSLKKGINKEEDKLFNNKVDEVVASVKKLQESNAEVNITEVEALLDNARRDIQTQRILNNPKVDATALLQDVEWELEKSFRDKVFDALGEGFQKVRTAVSERND